MRNSSEYFTLLFYSLLLLLCSACNKVSLPIYDEFNGPVKSATYQRIITYRWTFNDGRADKEVKETTERTYEYDEYGLLTERTYKSHDNDFERSVYSYTKEKYSTICHCTTYGQNTIYSTTIFDSNGRKIKSIANDERPGNYWDYRYDKTGRNRREGRFENENVKFLRETLYDDETECETCCEYRYDDSGEKKLDQKTITHYNGSKIAHVEWYLTEDGKESIASTTTYSKDGSKSTTKSYLDNGRYTISSTEMDDYGNPLHKEKSYSYKDDIDITDYEWEYDSYGNVTYQRKDYYDGSVSYDGMHYELHITETWDYIYYLESYGKGKMSIVGIIILAIVGILIVIGIIWEIKHPSKNDKRENKKMIIVWVIFLLVGCVSFYFDATEGTRHSSKSSYKDQTFVPADDGEGTRHSSGPSYKPTYHISFKTKPLTSSYSIQKKAGTSNTFLIKKDGKVKAVVMGGDRTVEIDNITYSLPKLK